VFHQAPDVYHVPQTTLMGAIRPERMQAGMTFTIEPPVTPGISGYDILQDGWTAITLDGSLTAQTEHTVLVTEHGVEILTA
jgi:methionyl aminopeptidase